MCRSEIGGLQDKMNQMELGFTDKLHYLEEAFSKLPDSISTSRGTASKRENIGLSRPGREESERNRQQLPPRVAKLEFPHYAGNDPTEWFNRVSQFFEYQKTIDDQKMALASFDLEGESNQWWQWLRRAYREKKPMVTWETFTEELWARFGSTECEDFDETLSHVKQTGILRDYQRSLKD